MEVVKVGMADLKVTSSPNRLRTTGLGSCVGVTLYDEKLHIVGMAHVMLPSSELSRGQVNVAKFADTAIPELVKQLELAGASRYRLIAKMAGGAQMFAFSGQNEMMRIGPRNVEACKEELKKLNIPVIAEDTGGTFGRTIEIDSNTGILYIRTVNQGEKEI
jgi:chemotaxis protein CheD